MALTRKIAWVRRSHRGVWHVLAEGHVTLGGRGHVKTKCGKTMDGYTIDRGGLIVSMSPPIVSSTGERRCFTCRVGIG